MTTHVTYAPGTWVALSTSSLWGIVEISLEDPLLPDLWAAAAVGLDDVLDVLLRRGLKALPGFALVHRSDALRYAARGPGSITSVAGDVSTPLDATMSGGWSSGTLPPQCTAVVLAGSATPPVAVVPTGTGLVAANALRVGLTGAHAGPTMPAPPGTGPLPDTTVAPHVDQAEQEPGEEQANEPANELADDPVIDPNDAEADAGNDQVSTYYELLVSSTGDRNKLLERLRAEQEAEQEQDTGRVATGPTTAGPAQVPVEATAAPALSDQIPGDSEPEPPGPEREPPARETTVIWTDEPEAAAGTGLIDGLPWSAGPPAGVPAATAGSGAPSAAPSPAVGSLARLTPPPLAGPTTPATIDAPVELATTATTAVTAPASTSAAPDEAGAGDEPESTARTLSRAELLRQLSREHDSRPTTLAVSCPSQHLSPPYAVVCRVCSVPLPEQEPVDVPRPLLGRLVLSNGSIVLLDKGVVFGRAPRTDAVTAADRPNLVRLADGLISRQHASVRLDGWNVLLRDLGSENGTVVTPPGGEPELIPPQEDHAIEPGTVVTLADTVSFTYEVTS